MAGISCGALHTPPPDTLSALEALRGMEAAARQGQLGWFVLYGVKFVVLSSLYCLFCLGMGVLGGVGLGLLSIPRGIEYFQQKGGDCCRAFMCCVLGICLLGKGFFEGVATVTANIALPGEPQPPNEAGGVDHQEQFCQARQSCLFPTSREAEDAQVTVVLERSLREWCIQQNPDAAMFADNVDDNDYYALMQDIQVSMQDGSAQERCLNWLGQHVPDRKEFREEFINRMKGLLREHVGEEYIGSDSDFLQTWRALAEGVVDNVPLNEWVTFVAETFSFNYGPSLGENGALGELPRNLRAQILQKREENCSDWVQKRAELEQRYITAILRTKLSGLSSSSSSLQSLSTLLKCVKDSQRLLETLDKVAQLGRALRASLEGGRAVVAGGIETFDEFSHAISDISSKGGADGNGSSGVEGYDENVKALAKAIDAVQTDLDSAEWNPQQDKRLTPASQETLLKERNNYPRWKEARETLEQGRELLNDLDDSYRDVALWKRALVCAGAGQPVNFEQVRSEVLRGGALA